MKDENTEDEKTLVEEMTEAADEIENADTLVEEMLLRAELEED